MNPLSVVWRNSKSFTHLTFPAAHILPLLLWRRGPGRGGLCKHFRITPHQQWKVSAEALRFETHSALRLKLTESRNSVE